MALKMTTSMPDIDKYMAKECTRIHNEIIRMLSFLGEKCVIEARDRSPEASWFDQTGNLRSSIGYVVVAGGQIVQLSSFNQVKDGSEGKQGGEDLAKKLAKNYKSGYALIVVAGMNYAAYVEAMDNKVVLTSAQLLAEKELPSMMDKLKTKNAR